MKFNHLTVTLFTSLSLMACGSSDGSSDSAQKELTTTQAQLKVEQAKANQAEKLAETAQQDLEIAKSNLESEKRKLADQISVNTTLQSALNASEEKREIKENELKEVKEKLEAEKAKLSMATTDREKLEMQLEELEKQFAQKESELATAKENVELEKAKLTEQIAKQKLIEANLAKAENALEEKQKRLDEVSAQLNIRLEAEQKLISEKQKIAEENIAWRKEEEEWFKSQMGSGNGNNPYPSNQFSTENIRFISVNGQFMPLSMNEPVPATDGNSRIHFGENRAYNQEYSFVQGHRQDAVVNQYGETRASRFNIESVTGFLTDVNAIPKVGSSTYQGKSFGAYGVGDFTYTINFDEKSGEGKISSLIDVQHVSDVILEKGNIQGNIIESTLRTENPRYSGSDSEPLTGSYILGIYGPNAEEVAGQAILDNVPRNMLRANLRTAEDGFTSEIGFGGKR